MDSILIVEPSATLQYVLRRVFARLPTALQVALTYAEAADRLRDGQEVFRAVVAGIPVGVDAGADELLSILNRVPYLDTAVVLMLHSAERHRLEWVEQRPRSAWLMWENHAECAARLEQLLLMPKSSAAEGVAAPIRVLFVDDARTVREAYRRLLALHDYDVIVAKNMNEALALATEQAFDIALVDYFMPGGNGDELCRRLRANPATANITSAILTATYVEEVIRHGLDAGAVEVMFKDEASELFLARLQAEPRRLSHVRKSGSLPHPRLSQRRHADRLAGASPVPLRPGRRHRYAC